LANYFRYMGAKKPLFALFSRDLLWIAEEHIPAQTHLLGR
jgi:hypothetical protein